MDDIKRTANHTICCLCTFYVIFSILLNHLRECGLCLIYNSRNFSILLNLGTFKWFTESTTVEIFLYYLTLYLKLSYNKISTTVEIFLYYLTSMRVYFQDVIYNSRNFSILLNWKNARHHHAIYNSRNFSILLNFNEEKLKELDHLQQ